jgi:tetratricopeptide (TPR) repeat protein
LTKAPANSQDFDLTVQRAIQLYDERRFDAAIAYIQQNVPPAVTNDPRTIMFLGQCQQLAGKNDDARASFERAEAAMKPRPDSVVVVDARQLPIYLARVYVGLGEKDKALEQARQGIAIYANDALSEPFAEQTLPLSRPRLAISILRSRALPHLLEVPNGETCGDLQINPLWDPLRKDPRFQKLCEEKQP